MGGYVQGGISTRRVLGGIYTRVVYTQVVYIRHIPPYRTQVVYIRAYASLLWSSGCTYGHMPPYYGPERDMRRIGPSQDPRERRKVVKRRPRT